MTIFEAQAKLTSKGQATIPLAVRKALELRQGDNLSFRVLSGGKVEIAKATPDPSQDSVVAAYLNLLEKDMLENPGKLNVLQRDPAISKLLEGVQIEEFDL